MKTWILPFLLICLLPNGAVADDAPSRTGTHERSATQSPFLARIPAVQNTMVNTLRRLHPAPDYSTIYQPRTLIYPTESDVPNYSADFDGSGIALVNSSLPRNKYAIGVQTNGMEGGGCVPIDVTNPFGGCVQIANSSGNLVNATAAREIWTFRFSYLDPSNASAAEVNIGAGGDYVLEWVLRTTGGQSCFTFYPCDYYHIDLNYLTGTVALSYPTCTMKLGAGYAAQVFYQASPYDAGAVPSGAQEWYPATVPATSTRLAQPGGIIYFQAYKLDRADNALNIIGGGLVHPAVDATGYTGSHDPLNLNIGSFNGQSETITVESYDCGVLPNIAFSIQRAFTETGGHAHSATSPPPLDRVSSLDSYSGTTDNTGHWSTTLHAGIASDTIKYTATSAALPGFTSPPLVVATGFIGLVDPGANDPNIRYTGVRAAHPSSHNGAPQLHAFVRNLAAQYNQRIADPALQGSLGLNDMSLPMGGIFDLDLNWASPHGQHSFGVACDIDHVVQRFTDGTFVDIDYEDTLTQAAQDLEGFLLIESSNNDNLHVQIPESQISDVLLGETR